MCGDAVVLVVRVSGPGGGGGGGARLRGHGARVRGRVRPLDAGGGKGGGVGVEECSGERIAVLHLNSPRNSLGSHRYGHERIGEGQVPVGAWPAFFEGLPGVPLVMETPYATPEVDAEQVRLVKELAGGLPLSQ